MADVISNQKTYTIWKLEWPDILKGEETDDIARELLKNLRKVDRREISAFTGDIAREIHESIDWSYELQYATAKDGQLIAVWGVQPKRERDKDECGSALIWCLGTDLVRTYAFSFAKESKRILQEWGRRYGVLFNMVGTFNKDAIHWLKWLGAYFDKQGMMVRGGEKFVPFIICYEEGGK